MSTYGVRVVIGKSVPTLLMELYRYMAATFVIVSVPGSRSSGTSSVLGGEGGSDALYRLLPLS